MLKQDYNKQMICYWIYLSVYDIDIYFLDLKQTLNIYKENDFYDSMITMVSLIPALKLYFSSLFSPN